MNEYSSNNYNSENTANKYNNFSQNYSFQKKKKPEMDSFHHMKTQSKKEMLTQQSVIVLVTEDRISTFLDITKVSLFQKALVTLKIKAQVFFFLFYKKLQF